MTRVGFITVCAIAAAVFLPCHRPLPAAAAQLSPQEKRGEYLYFSGRSPSGAPITAYFGEDLIELAGEFATCGSCHGHDGLGRPESGVIPTNITWKYLTKAYGHLHPGGVEHLPFDEESLKDYMLSGVYPGGKRGDPAMPVYDMSPQDLQDLIVYMKRVGELLDPGLSETSVRIGTLVPAEGPQAEAGRAMRALLEADFRRVNEEGGIYGRRLELVSYDLPPERKGALEGVRAWMKEASPFMLVGTFTPGLDQELANLLAEEEVPLVGPFTLSTAGEYARNRQVFYLWAGVREQVQVMIRYAAEQLPEAGMRMGVVHAGGDPTLQGTAEDACRSRGMKTETVALAPDGEAAAVAHLKTRGVGTVLLLCDGKTAEIFLKEAERVGWHPHVLTLGVLAGNLPEEAPPSFDRRLFLVFPTLPRDRTAEGMGEIIGRSGGRPAPHGQALVCARAAARIALEGLRRTGKALTRRDFVARLERFWRFPTGLTPPVTFTGNKRIGADGAYVVRVDRRTDTREPLAEWVNLD